MTMTMSAERFSSMYDLDRNYKRSRGMFQSQGREHELRDVRIEGKLPPEIRGTHYSIGPGQFEVAGQRVQHIFDGDGMMVAFRFDGKSVSFKNRFIKTPEYAAEQAAGRRLYGAFGSVPPPGRLGILPRIGAFKNSMNHGVSVLNNRLLAMTDGALPFELDPATLETLAPFDLYGALGRSSLLTAHPHADPATGEVYNLELDYISLRPGFTLWKSDGSRTVKLAACRTSGLPFIHDMAITKSCIVVAAGSLVFDPRMLMLWALGRKPLMSCFDWPKDRPSEVYVISRRDGSLLRKYTLEPGFCFHFCNAYDTEEGIDVDVSWYANAGLIKVLLKKYLDGSPSSEEVRTSMPVLRRLHLHRNGTWRSTQFSDVGMEFFCVPEAVYTTKHRYAYPLDFCSLSKVYKVDTWTGEHLTRELGESMFLSQCSFVSRPSPRSEDDGWLLSLVYDSSDHHSFLSVISAASFQEEARIHLPFHVPARFHCTFLPAGQLAS